MDEQKEKLKLGFIRFMYTMSDLLILNLLALFCCQIGRAHV